MKRFFCLCMAFCFLMCGCGVVDISRLASDKNPKDAAFADCFSSDMVLQRDTDINIFGTGVDGTVVFIEFGGARYRTVVSDGKWNITLPPAAACAQAQTLTLFTQNGRCVLENVLVGDVWLCAGQSNMAYSINAFDMYDSPEIQAAMQNENLRLCLTEFELEYDDKTGDYLAASAVTGCWETSDYCEIYSGYGTVFAQRLQEQTGVPIGMYQVAMNSTPISQWIPGGRCFEYGLAPYAGMSIKGVLWYQGENDARFMSDFRETYPPYFTEMCSSLRELFGNETLPVYATQLASYLRPDDASWTDKDWADMRLLQIELAEQVPNTYIIPNSDLVADYRNIHPDTKPVLGKRAAELALANTYQKPEFIKEYPAFDSVTYCEDGVIVTFKNLQGNLTSSGAPSEFRVCGADGIYVDAQAQIVSGDKIKVFAPDGLQIEGVSYCYAALTIPNLTDGANPILPFKITK